MDSRYIVIFDGYCNACNSAVNFIIRHDPQRVFAFTPMQSDTGIALTDQYHVDNITLDTLVLIKQGECYIRTDAALEIARELNRPWHLLTVFKIIPRPLRDYIYQLFAKYRYRLFGKRNHCTIPAKTDSSRFI